MTRSNARELAVHLIYELDYTNDAPEAALLTRLEKEYYDGLSEENDVYSDRPSKKQLAYVEDCVKGVTAERDALDEQIRKYAIGWNLHRISRLSKCAMRLAMYEILHVEDVPTGVAINECVALTRKYEDPEVAAFVNGILGSFARGMEVKAE